MSELLPQRFLAIAAQRGARPAVMQGKVVTGFDELAARAVAVGSALCARIQVGERVALIMDNSPDYVACVYGIWLAGGVVVGLNTALKGNELVWQIEHCAAAWLIVDPKKAQELASLLPEYLLERVIVAGAGANSLDAMCATISADERWVALRADSPAQIIYTSGTTGQPKGVLLSHGNLATNVEAIQHYLAIRADDIAMCVLPFFYSFGNSVLHTHLTSGSALVLENSLMYPQVVLQQIQAQRVTAFYGVPSTYYILLARTQLANAELGSLRYCAQAGGAMDPVRIERFCGALPGTDFIVMYGQTEASARLSWLPASDRQRKSGSVGVAVPGVTLTIRDEVGVELGVGITGEVCAQGTSVMQGYWNDTDTTRQTIRNGWLYTGDLGYRDDDGYLYLVGRSKEMIKSGAHRISPREIEELIAVIPGIDDVAVIGVEDELLGQTIKACVIAVEDDALRRQILKHCRECLPLYKVPKDVGFYREFPRTASGKIQKHLLT